MGKIQVHHPTIEVKIDLAMPLLERQLNQKEEGKTL